MSYIKNPSKPSLTDPVQLHILSNKKIILDGRFEITEYDEESIEFSNPALKVRLFGSDITVRELNDQSADITGIFVRIDFS